MKKTIINNDEKKKKPEACMNSINTSIKTSASPLTELTMSKQQTQAYRPGIIVGGTIEPYLIEEHFQTCLYGSIYRGVGLYTGDVVAIKIISESQINKQQLDRELPETPLAEVFFAPYLKGHPNVLVIREAWFVDDVHLVISDFAEAEDLLEILKHYPQGMPEDYVRFFMRQAASALDFCHSRHIAMQDFSLENCLVFVDDHGLCSVRVCDPGQATRFSISKKTKVEIPVLYAGCVGKKFRPPEIFKELPYLASKVDSWCLGWATFYLLFAIELLQSTDDIRKDNRWLYFQSNRFEELFQLLGVANSLSSVARDFILRLMHPNPLMRMSIHEALEHEFLKMKKITNYTLNISQLPAQFTSSHFTRSHVICSKYAIPPQFIPKSAEQYQKKTYAYSNLALAPIIPEIYTKLYAYRLCIQKKPSGTLLLSHNKHKKETHYYYNKPSESFNRAKTNNLSGSFSSTLSSSSSSLVSSSSATAINNKHRKQFRHSPLQEIDNSLKKSFLSQIITSEKCIDNKFVSSPPLHTIKKTHLHKEEKKQEEKKQEEKKQEEKKQDEKHKKHHTFIEKLRRLLSSSASSKPNISNAESKHTLLTQQSSQNLNQKEKLKHQRSHEKTYTRYESQKSVPLLEISSKPCSQKTKHHHYESKKSLEPNQCSSTIIPQEFNPKEIDSYTIPMHIKDLDQNLQNDNNNNIVNSHSNSKSQHYIDNQLQSSWHSCSYLTDTLGLNYQRRHHCHLCSQALSNTSMETTNTFIRTPPKIKDTMIFIPTPPPPQLEQQQQVSTYPIPIKTVVVDDDPLQTFIPLAVSPSSSSSYVRHSKNIMYHEQKSKSSLMRVQSEKQLNKNTPSNLRILSISPLSPSIMDDNPLVITSDTTTHSSKWMMIQQKTQPYMILNQPNYLENQFYTSDFLHNQNKKKEISLSASSKKRRETLPKKATII